MVKSRILRAASVAAASVGLVVGLTGIAGASSGSIMNTGPDSSNKIINKTSSTVTVHNHNNVALANSNDQGSWTGSASVKHNTTGGSATSGDASNDNSTHVVLSVTNTTPSMQGSTDCGCAGGGTIGAADAGTGPDSLNLIVTKDTTKVDVQNTNDITLSNSSDQTAKSGKASVSDNTTGGSATSGDAMNTNSTSFNLTVSN